MTMQPALHGRPERFGPYRLYVVFVLLLAYIFAFADRQIMALLVEPMRADMGLTDFQIGLLQGWAFSLFYAVMGVPISMLADRLNRRNIIAAGIALWSAMTAACGLASTTPGLFAARMGVGVGEAALSPSAHSLISDYFSPRQLPRAMAIYSLGITMGVGLAFLGGGLVISFVMHEPMLTLPIFGTLASWKVVFLTVGLPGLLIALLMLTVREPVRKGLLRDESGAALTMKLKPALAFWLQRRYLYAPLILGISMMSVYTYGVLAWYPTFLIRTYGLTMTEAGIAIGLIYLFFGLSGTLAGPPIAAWLERRGHADAHVRLIAGVTLLCIVPGVLGPVMPSAGGALAMLVPLVFLKATTYASSTAAFQLVTPNQARAQVSAVNIFVNNIIGMGLGATLVAAFTDFVFRDEQALRYSLLCAAVASSVPGWLLLRRAMKPFQDALEAMHGKPVAAPLL